jgi:hypothetical protein
MDQYIESGWKHDPTAAEQKIDEDESSKLLTAFSWKKFWLNATGSLQVMQAVANAEAAEAESRLTQANRAANGMFTNGGDKVAAAKVRDPALN